MIGRHDHSRALTARTRNSTRFLSYQELLQTREAALSDFMNKKHIKLDEPLPERHNVARVTLDQHHPVGEGWYGETGTKIAPQRYAGQVPLGSLQFTKTTLIWRNSRWEVVQHFPTTGPAVEWATQAQKSSMRKISLYLLGAYMLGIDVKLLLSPMKDENDPGPDDMEVFRSSAESMYKSAVAKGELEDLRGAIEYHLGHDDAFLEREFDSSLAELVQSEAYRPEWALKRILGFVHKTLWPTAETD